jgi:hypothetical protein
MCPKNSDCTKRVTHRGACKIRTAAQPGPSKKRQRVTKPKPDSDADELKHIELQTQQDMEMCQQMLLVSTCRTISETSDVTHMMADQSLRALELVGKLMATKSDTQKYKLAVDGFKEELAKRGEVTAGLKRQIADLRIALLCKEKALKQMTKCCTRQQALIQELQQ